MPPPSYLSQVAQERVLLHLLHYLYLTRIKQHSLVLFWALAGTDNRYPILDTRISFSSFSFSSVTLRPPPLDSETGWTGELWSKTKFLILEN